MTSLELRQLKMRRLVIGRYLASPQSVNEQREGLDIMPLLAGPNPPQAGICKCGEQVKAFLFPDVRLMTKRTAAPLMWFCFCPKRGCHAGNQMPSKAMERDAIAQWNASDFCKQPKPPPAGICPCGYFTGPPAVHCCKCGGPITQTTDPRPAMAQHLQSVPMALSPAKPSKPKNWRAIRAKIKAKHEKSGFH